MPAISSLRAGRAALLLLLACAPAAAHDEPAGTPADAYKVSDTTLLESVGPKEQFGAWYVPPLPPRSDRMQSVHVVLLPSGKVLIASGSSFRVKYDKSTGRFAEGVDGTDYDVVDNTGIYDPALDLDKDGLHPLGRNAFRKIASPPTGKTKLQAVLGKIDDPDAQKDDTFWSNDLFCAGHLHSPDGNVVFTGGNRMNYPGMLFTGARFANIFDWKTETWRCPRVIADGHWYPSLVELADGTLMTVSGLGFVNQGTNNNNSPIIEFYDYRKPPDQAWTSRNIRKLHNSPFNTPIQAGHAELDRLDHYPRMFALADGRFLITGDGSGGGNPKSRKTYLMSVKPAANPGEAPEISFELGPDRPADRRIYGTGLIDPNTPGDVLLIGGMLGSERTTIGPTFPPLNKDAVTANLERFRAPKDGNDPGSWEHVPQFLGDRPSDVRIMHVATILPTREFLIMGGGNYAFHNPIFAPQLFSPNPNVPGGYEGKRMNPATQPRLYHSVSLLLPDGRVLASGGNAVRAAIEVNAQGRFAPDRRVYFNTARNPRNDVFGFAEPATQAIPAEIHQVEIFYPPYLFARGARPVIKDAPSSLKYGEKATFRVDHPLVDDENGPQRDPSVVLIKLGSVTHSLDYGQRLCDLKFDLDRANGSVTIDAPANANVSPPGYYMLFYVNDVGKPSVASIVRLDQ